jgi:hypothetical protein
MKTDGSLWAHSRDDIWHSIGSMLSARPMRNRVKCGNFEVRHYHGVERLGLKQIQPDIAFPTWVGLPLEHLSFIGTYVPRIALNVASASA